jgi:gluconate 2-dehydrogenase gamma chain
MTKRRDVVKALAAAPIVAFTWSREDIDRAAESVARLTEQQYSPVFFNAQEWRTVRVLVDDIIPADSRSGSATSAKVPEFMDFILNDGNENNRTTQRNGLTWLNQESQKRFGKGYADAAPAERHKILDDIAWPARAPAEFRQNVTWFNSFRNLTASGFFSSRVGLRDLNYTGNAALPRWTGASPAMMQKLGLSYDAWDKKYGRGF